jgi:hypothetical protein
MVPIPGLELKMASWTVSDLILLSSLTFRRQIQFLCNIRFIKYFIRSFKHSSTLDHNPLSKIIVNKVIHIRSLMFRSDVHITTNQNCTNSDQISQTFAIIHFNIFYLLISNLKLQRLWYIEYSTVSKLIFIPLLMSNQLVRISGKENPTLVYKSDAF